MKLQSMMSRVVKWMAYVAVIGMIGAPSARADFTAAFNSGQNDFTTNFFIARGVATQFVWQPGGWMRFDNASAYYASFIYDTKVPPSGSNPLSVFGGGTQKEVYAIDFLVGHEKESAGICARIQGTGIGTGGYGVWLNVDDGSKAFSLFRLSSAFAGTSLASVSLETDLIAVDTWYTLVLTLQNVDGNVQLSAFIKNRSTAAAVGGTIAYNDTAANRVTTGGRFGARVQIASTVTYTDFDNLAATLIPDPPRGTIVTVR